MNRYSLKERFLEVFGVFVVRIIAVPLSGPQNRYYPAQPRVALDGA
jgi:hypothetical protein